MTSVTSTSGDAVRHRISWITGALTIALIPAGILNDHVAPMQPELGLIAHFAALLTAIATALCAGNRVLKRTAWILVPVCWILSFYGWLGYIWTGSGSDWSDDAVTPIFYALIAMPPAWLILAVWKRTRSGTGSFLAEAGALVVLALMLFVLTLHISTVVEPKSPAGWLALLYAAAAGLLVLAAWRRPSRRVAYGFVALLLAAIAAGSHWLFYREDPAVTPVGFIGIEVFAPVALLLVPVVAATLQLAWTSWRKTRTGSEPTEA
jgi:hypothetical protein